MDGLLVIDKPAGLTSHDVVARVRRILGTRRVGHTGTLDPFATGVMVILVGKATRLAQFLDKDEKEYDALVQFGFETDTGDGTGKQKAEGGRQKAEGGMRNEEVSDILSSVDWEIVFDKFRGEIMQTPPMYSAKKIEGKKLYELARKGIEAERKPIKVFIKELELLPNEFRTPHSAIRIRTACSAGTYIRTLAEDIGREVGIGAHLAELRRTRAGKFDLDAAVTLEQLEKMEEPAAVLKPMTDAVTHLPEIRMSSDRARKTRDGLATRVDEELDDGTVVRMLDENSNMIAIGIYEAEQKQVKPRIVLL